MEMKSDYEKITFLQMGELYAEVKKDIGLALRKLHEAAISSNIPYYLQFGEKISQIHEILETMDRKHL